MPKENIATDSLFGATSVQSLCSSLDASRAKWLALGQDAIILTQVATPQLFSMFLLCLFLIAVQVFICLF